MPVPNDLSKLNDVVKNDVVKRTEYDKLATKVNNIDIGTGKFIWLWWKVTMMQIN